MNLSDPVLFTKFDGFIQLQSAVRASSRTQEVQDRLSKQSALALCMSTIRVYDTVIER